MRSTSGKDQPSGSRTLSTAWGVVLAVAGLQALVGMAGSRGKESSPAAAVINQPVAETPQVVVAKASLPETVIEKPAKEKPAKENPEKSRIEPPVAASQRSAEPTPSPVVAPAPVMAVAPPAVANVTPAPAQPPKPTQPTSLDVAITDTAILEELEQGLFCREKQDLLSAVGHFRKAYELQPDHPKLIYQLAKTYDAMGLEKRSAPLWKTLVSLGNAAGDYYALAKPRMEGGSGASTSTSTSASAPAAPAAPSLTTDVVPAKLLTLCEISTQKVKEERNGERQVVQFSLKKNTPDTVAAEDVAVVVQFFETLNGRKIDRSQLPEEPQIFQREAPLDWPAGATEPMQVDYFQPRMSPAEILRFGHRTYYGQVIEVFWKGELQDRAADPPELVEFSKEIPLPPESASPLPAPIAGADGGLFPSSSPTPTPAPVTPPQPSSNSLAQ